MTLIKKEFKINTATFSCFIFTLIKPDGTEEFWFKGKDIAEFLEYKNTKQAIIINVHEKWRNTWENLRRSISNPPLNLPKNLQPHTVFISEPGLYALITKSTKPEAITFSSWVYEEVLPSLRKTGEYKIVIQEKDDQIVLKDRKIEELAMGLLKANDALILANINAEKARQDAINAFNRIADIAQDVIAKPAQTDLLHARLT